MIIDQGEAEVDNHFRRVNIPTITLSGMYFLFHHTEIIECRRRVSQTHSTSFWPYRKKYRNDVALFWCNGMMSYLTFMITECLTAQAVQIWFQHVRFNLCKKTCDEIRVLIVPSLK